MSARPQITLLDMPAEPCALAPEVVYDANADLRYWNARAEFLQERLPAPGTAAELVRAHGIEVLKDLELSSGSGRSQYVPASLIETMAVEHAGSPWLAWRGRAVMVESQDSTDRSGSLSGLVNLNTMRVADQRAARRAIADRILNSLTGVELLARGEWLKSPETRDLACRVVASTGSPAATSSDATAGTFTFRTNFYLPDSYLVTSASLTGPDGEVIGAVDQGLFGGFAQERQAALMHLEFEHFDVPAEIQAMTRAALAEFRCFGLNDPMYLANYAAVRMGVGNGRGQFDRASIECLGGREFDEHLYRHAEHCRATYLGPLGIAEERSAVDRIFTVMHDAIDLARSSRELLAEALVEGDLEQPLELGRPIDRPRGN